MSQTPVLSQRQPSPVLQSTPVLSQRQPSPVLQSQGQLTAPRQITPLPTFVPSNQITQRPLTPVSQTSVSQTSVSQRAPTPTLSSVLNSRPPMTQSVRQIPVSPLTQLTRPLSPTIPTEERNITISDSIKGVIEKNSVEYTLVNNGYIPKDKIVTKNGNGQMGALYIKAINSFGQTVFVELDDEGYVSTDKDDLTMVREEKANDIPYSIKMGIAECMNTEVCGVAFDCNESICTMIRQPDSNTPKEENFIYTEKRSERAAILGDKVIAYPIVRLTEIKANPNLVLENTNVATGRIRNAAYEKSMQEINESSKSVLELENAFIAFNEKRVIIQEQLNRSISDLTLMNVEYLNNKSMTDEEKEKHRLVQINLRKRNELIVELLNFCKQIGDMKSVLNAQLNKIYSIMKMIDRDFGNLDSIITE
jgi:hypothetical protein